MLQTPFVVPVSLSWNVTVYAAGSFKRQEREERAGQADRQVERERKRDWERDLVHLSLHLLTTDCS